MSVGIVFGGRYRVVRRLGTGGSGAVFLAHDAVLDRDVAVKRLHGAEVTAQTAMRLRREARIMASLQHPNLVAVYDMLVDGDDVLLVMEYVPGETLADVLRDGPIEWESVVGLLAPVAAALDYAHDCGVVHRDLKPANVLVGANGVVKVADLGVATAAEITKITPPGAILGTPAYMAPEQAQAQPCTAAVDIYAFATILFQALAGALPRSGKTVVAIVAQATREPPADLRTHRPDAPAAAAEALARGMSADPERRQRSAEELLSEVSAAFETSRAAAPARLAAGPPAATRNVQARVAAIAALTAAVVGVAVVLATLAGGKGPAPKPTPVGARERPRETTATASPSATRSPASAAPAASPSASPSPANATPVSAAALSPAATVRAFYRRAAAGDYRAAWALAGPGMRSAFGDSFARFTHDLSTLRRIHFTRLTVVATDQASATVQIETVATHSDRVDHCAGTLRTVRGPGRRWLVEPAGVRCTSA